MTHVRDGNEIVPIKETPYNKIGEFPRLPTRVLTTPKLKCWANNYKKKAGGCRSYIFLPKVKVIKKRAKWGL